MKKTSDDAVCIAENAYVRVTKMNHLVEVQHMAKTNRQNNIKKLDRNRYVEISTGEIKEFKHSENRKQNENSLRQTFKKLRYLINNNFVGKPNELHITLTYAENMRDAARLYTDFNKFMKRFRYFYKDRGHVDYICVVEPQERGAWHCHVLMRFNQLDKVYIKNADVRALWGLGHVKVQSLRDIDNIGAYLSAYLSDLDITEHENVEEIEKILDVETKLSEGKPKKVVKGFRLRMYPPGINIYRKSKGIAEPERVEMPYKAIKKVVGGATPHYQRKLTIQDGDFENTIQYEQYNLKRIELEQENCVNG